jgi:opacity protein-like surface antigen
MTRRFTLAALSAAACSSPALAQDDAGWSVMVTPRYQDLLFLPDN